jgi:type I pantothenate kinase
MIEPDLGEDARAAARGETPGLALLLSVLRDRRPDRGCFIIGVTGAVACGKSTLSNTLREQLLAWPERPSVEVAATDGFLHPNTVLDALGLTARKGFPESYDTLALRRALSGVRVGPADFPGYSHITYDVDPALSRRIDRPDILIVEGLSLDLDRGAGEAGARLLDTLIYLDAAEADIAQWFVARFLGLWEAAEHDPASFYARFRGLDREQATTLARTVWEKVNLPNLREHIAAAREVADIVVRKRLDHRIEAVTAT